MTNIFLLNHKCNRVHHYRAAQKGCKLWKENVWRLRIPPKSQFISFYKPRKTCVTKITLNLDWKHLSWHFHPWITVSSTDNNMYVHTVKGDKTWQVGFGYLGGLENRRKIVAPRMIKWEVCLAVDLKVTTRAVWNPMTWVASFSRWAKVTNRKQLLTGTKNSPATWKKR